MADLATLVSKLGKDKACEVLSQYVDQQDCEKRNVLTIEALAKRLSEPILWTIS